MDHRYKCKTIKLLEENRVENLCDLWFGKEFLDSTPKRWPIKEKWVNWTSWELATFSSVKRTILRMKRQATNCKKILGNHLFHKGLGKARIYKAFSKFNSKTTTQLKDGQKTGTSTWSSLLDHLQSASLELTLAMRRILRKMHWIIHLSTTCQSFILFSKLLFSLDCLHLCEILGRDSSPHLAGSITDTLGG